MNMKDHILAALREQFEAWDELLANLSVAEINTPQFDLDWSIKDVMAHLWAWQQISLARMEAGSGNTNPAYPAWILSLGAGWEEDSNRVNALTHETSHDKPWPEIYQNWREGFLRFLDAGAQLTERDLLDGDRYSWLKGYSLAFILVASYEHHQEHLEKLTNWLTDHR